MSLDVQATFKVPEALPQDLLLIRDLVGELSVSHATNALPVTKSEAEEDDINSSSSEDDSEDELDEVEANLDVKSEEDDGVSPAKA
jgi:H/ACA ribonucleoprotein complex non-core subunit NAF1